MLESHTRATTPEGHGDTFAIRVGKSVLICSCGRLDLLPCGVNSNFECTLVLALMLSTKPCFPRFGNSPLVYKRLWTASPYEIESLMVDVT